MLNGKLKVFHVAVHLSSTGPCFLWLAKVHSGFLCGLALERTAQVRRTPKRILLNMNPRLHAISAAYHPYAVACRSIEELLRLVLARMAYEAAMISPFLPNFNQ